METLPAREFDNIRIAVPWGHISGRWYGNRDVRPILAMHGWLDNLGTWETLIPLLPAHIGILAIDLPGHGQSSRYPKGITYHSLYYVDIVIRIMKEYNWQKVSLMGHSLGAILCFIYTSIYPQTVDLLIAMDVINPIYRRIEYDLRALTTRVEKLIIEDERIDKLALEEPPSYTYAQLEQLLYEGSGLSVDLENCKYVLNPSIAKSTKYPDKYYFSRDGKVKYYVEFHSTPELTLEMCKRIRNVPYFVVKGSLSSFINKDSIPIIQLLRKNNPHFEMHTIQGTHHVHLNNAKAVAAVLNPFLNRHRPVTLDSWSLDAHSGNRKAMANIATTKQTKWLTSKL